jgi:hypothetical protein
MASILGNRTDPVERTGFPGEGGLERREVANETDIDLAVRTLLDEALDRATAILTEQGSGVQAAWRLRDGLDLVVEVQARAARRADGAIGWENLAAGPRPLGPGTERDPPGHPRRAPAGRAAGRVRRLAKLPGAEGRDRPDGPAAGPHGAPPPVRGLSMAGGRKAAYVGV